jgi:hypothetical protein
MRLACALALAVAFAATCVVAEEQREAPAQWPPPESVEARMHELQGILASRESSPAEREAAREELANLLKSPAGQARGRTRDEKPARAAIQPFPSVARPLANPPIHVPGVAELEVVAPPARPIVVPQTGGVVTPTGPGSFAVNPITGNTLHPVPGGYVDPKTGQFVPR